MMKNIATRSMFVSPGNAQAVTDNHRFIVFLSGCFSGATIPCFVNSDVTSRTMSRRTDCTEFGSEVLLVPLQIISPSFLVSQTSITSLASALEPGYLSDFRDGPDHGIY